MRQRQRRDQRRLSVLASNAENGPPNGSPLANARLINVPHKILLPIPKPKLAALPYPARDC
jgi:hypothetical protein